MTEIVLEGYNDDILYLETVTGGDKNREEILLPKNRDEYKGQIDICYDDNAVTVGIYYDGCWSFRLTGFDHSELTNWQIKPGSRDYTQKLHLSSFVTPTIFVYDYRDELVWENREECQECGRPYDS